MKIVKDEDRYMVVAQDGEHFYIEQKELKEEYCEMARRRILKSTEQSRMSI